MSPQGNTIVIATHDGMFHSDDCFSVAALLKVLEKNPAPANVVRTRDPKMLAAADFVVDVGGVYDEEKNRFDHHQEGGAGQRASTIPYASFGLVWQKFGADIAGSKEVAAIVDHSLVSPVDAHDTGIDIYKKVFPDTKPYMINNFVHNLRPTWREDAKSVDARFLEAVAFARKVLEREITHAIASLAAKSFVLEAYQRAEDKRIIILDAYYPHEETLALFPEPLFAVSPRPDGKWNVRTLRDDVSLFKNRRDLPEAWAGKRDAEFAAITGVPDALFCHNGRFMAVAKSKEGAIALTQKALKS